MIVRLSGMICIILSDLTVTFKNCRHMQKSCFTMIVLSLIQSHCTAEMSPHFVTEQLTYQLPRPYRTLHAFNSFLCEKLTRGGQGGISCTTPQQPGCVICLAVWTLSGPVMQPLTARPADRHYSTLIVTATDDDRTSRLFVNTIYATDARQDLFRIRLNVAAIMFCITNYGGHKRAKIHTRVG